MAWQHLSDSRPKARKRHSCYLCCNSIQPGQVYVRRNGVEGREFHSVAMHLECEEQTRDWDYIDWECFTPGDWPDECTPQ